MRAFTILELLVVLIISALIISMGITMYKIVNIRFIKFKNVNTELRESYLLNALLAKDITESQLSIKLNDHLELNSYKKVVIKYFFLDDAIIRISDLKTDTFHCSPSEILFEFSGKKVNYDKGVIDKIYFSALILGRREHFCFSKQYGSDILMQLDNDRK